MISSTLSSIESFLEKRVETVEEEFEAVEDKVETEVEELKNSITARITSKEIDQKKCIVDNPVFHVSVILMTLLNTIQMGLEADHPEWTETWVICENVFTAGFAVEMTIKLIVLKRLYFTDKANWLDGTLTVLGILDCWILSLLGGEADLQSLSILRILRLLRLARILKLAANFKPCVLVLQGLMRAIQTTLYVFLLLLLILYVFAIFLTGQLGKGDTSMYPGYSATEEVIDEQELMQNYNPYICFGSMANTMLTLFNMAMMAEWQEIIRPLAIKQPIYLVVFIFFALLVVFGVMNVMIGSIVDSVLAESRRIDEELAADHLSKKISTLAQIEKLLIDMDENGDGTIDYEELTHAMKTHPFLLDLMKDIDLPSGWSGHELLDMLDNSGDGKLQRAEFTTSFFRLLESDSFQQICIMQASINNVKHMILDSSNTIQDKLLALEAELSSMKKTATCETVKSQEHSATGEHPTRKPSQHQSDIERDKLADAPEISNIEIARCMDGLCAELREQILSVSSQTSKEIHRAARESFQKQFALIEPSLENAGMPLRSGEPDPDVGWKGHLNIVEEHVPVVRADDCDYSRSLAQFRGSVREVQCATAPDEFGEGMRQSDETLNLRRGPLLEFQCAAALDAIDKDIHQSAEYINLLEGSSSCVPAATPSLQQDIAKDIEYVCCAESAVNPADHPLDLSHEHEFEFAEKLQLGCEIHWVRDALPIIGGVVPEGAASIRGIHAGDRLSKCNGVSVDGKDRATVLQLLRLRPLRLRVIRGDA